MNTYNSDEIEFLIKNYSTMSNNEISEVLGRNRDSIRHKAKSLGLRKLGRRHDITTAHKLLDGSLISLYWIGFILADGHLDKTYRLSVTLSIKDKQHLAKLAEYLNVSVKELRSNKASYSPDNIMVQLRANNKIYMKQLANFFDIKNNKTYDPPNFSMYRNLSIDQWIALIIGFIDGDGCIQKHIRATGNTALNIHLNVHENWLSNLQYIDNIIKTYIPIHSNMAPRLRYGMAKYDISNNQIICKLKEFVVKHDLPVLSRKWDKIDHTMSHVRNYKA